MERLFAYYINMESFEVQKDHLVMCASTLRTWQKLEFKTCYMLLLVIEKVISKALSQDLNVNSSVANILYTLLNTEIRSHFGTVIDQ